MPSRYDVFYNGGIYHVFDKTIENIPIFSTENIAFEFINTFLYYRSLKSNYRYSFFKKLDSKSAAYKWRELHFSIYFKVDILSYCLMPNHYHFLLKQLQDNGIKTFMANIINSITRFYNIQNKRKGPVFLTQFKSNTIRSEEQMVYVSRYIHTNPYAGGLTDNIEDIFSYPYSSIGAYTDNQNNRFKINTELILNYFNNKQQKYKDFIINNAEDQKSRELVKYTDKWLG